MRPISLPLNMGIINSLHSGDFINLTGIVYTARDAAHKRLINMIHQNKKLPFDLKNQVIFYTGPTPAKAGEPIGACGPTTSYRMDDLTLELLKLGLKGMIGKGFRSANIKQKIKEFNALYFVTPGGIAALLANTIEKSELVAFPELGAEAIYRLQLKDFPCIVAYDSYGNDLFEIEKKKYKLSRNKNE